jgi:hypothetical protein
VFEPGAGSRERDLEIAIDLVRLRADVVLADDLA